MGTQKYYWFLFKVLFSMLTYCADVASDIFLVIKYFLENQIIYSVLTLVFIFIPYFINFFINLMMFERLNFRTAEENMRRESIKSFVIPSLLSPMWRYVRAIKESWIRKNWGTESGLDYDMLECNILNLFECLFESAPQLTLQLYILIHTHINVDVHENTNTVISQYLSISTSFCSIAWNLKTCVTSDDQGLPFTKFPSPYIVPICYFLWQFSCLGSRILCISIMLSYDLKSTIAMLIIHWILMTLWMVLDSHSLFPFFDFIKSSWQFNKIYLPVVWGFSYVFTISTTDRICRTNYNIYLKYYFIVTVETIIVTTMLARSSNDYWQSLLYLKSTIIYLVNGLLQGSLIFMLMYVKFCKKHSKKLTSRFKHNVFNNHLTLIGKIINNYFKLIYYLLPQNNNIPLVYFTDINTRVMNLHTEQVILIENITSILTTVIIPNYFDLVLSHQNCDKEKCQSCEYKIWNEIDRFVTNVQLRRNEEDDVNKFVLLYCPITPDHNNIRKDLQSMELDFLHEKLKVLQENCEFSRQHVIKNYNPFDSFHHVTSNMRPLDLEHEMHEFADLHKKLNNLVQKTKFMYELATTNYFDDLLTLGTKDKPKLRRCLSDSSLYIKIATTNYFDVLLTLGSKAKSKPKLGRCLSDSSIYIKIPRTNYFDDLLTLGSKVKSKLRRGLFGSIVYLPVKRINQFWMKRYMWDTFSVTDGSFYP